MTDTGTIVLAYMGLRAAAAVADHWVQTDHQATHKALDNWKGRLACGRHVATYVATQLAAVALLFAVAGESQHWWGLVWGGLLSAVTHFWADRRWTIKWLADVSGKGNFVRMTDHGINGAYALDQSWHHGWEAVAAVLIGLS